MQMKMQVWEISGIIRDLGGMRSGVSVEDFVHIYRRFGHGRILCDRELHMGTSSFMRRRILFI